jgi:hypothetical protein
MRFVADGPAIPDELLEQRDHGNVVFFCGAGVSVPSGLPGFWKLTARTMRELGTPVDAKSRKLFERPRAPGEDPPFDQVFNLLQQEYRRSEVEKVVGQLLRTPRRPRLEPHKIILRLSRNARRLPHIVTTNFDRLFEAAYGRLEIHLPPALPDLSLVGSFDGIIYLHGRRVSSQVDARARQQLILSSSDFGRAYLADGWATRFVRDLLRTYVIVLVGYSASDPPVRYLLEGLHSRQNKNHSAIYAFDKAENGEDVVRDRWRSLGVVAIPYATGDAHHTGLWSTLEAWANQADNPEGWRRSAVALAQTSPKTLQPFQRGQVVSLIRTSQGAMLFAAATPPPPAEWLCVFDRLIRSGTNNQSGSSEELDARAIYGLDDDPQRPAGSLSSGDANDLLEDLISMQPRDERVDGHKRLAGTSMAVLDPLPSRLAHLASWVVRVAHDPVAIWWAAGYETLHPRILYGIERDFRTVQHSQSATYRLWRLLLERSEHGFQERHDWYHVLSRLKYEGWTSSALRAFERVAQPHLTAKRAWRHRVVPPTFQGEIPLRQFADFEIEFPTREQEKLDIPSLSLPAVFEIARRALRRGLDLLLEIDTSYWRTPSFDPPEQAQRQYHNGLSRYLHWLRALFDRLVAEHPAIARAEIRSWPSDDPHLFGKLKIYAWMNPALIPGDETAAGILSLPEDSFWNHDHLRELLHTLRSRWKDFNDLEREQIEHRIAGGASRSESEVESEYHERVAHSAATMLGWLQTNGCELSAGTRAALPAFRNRVPGWTPAWDASADMSLEASGGWIRTDADPSALVSAPLADVIALAGEAGASRRHPLIAQKPFTGLVSQHPRRALAALSLETRHSRFPIPYWQALLDHWPDTTSDRLLMLCAARLCRLPNDTLLQCRYSLMMWFKKHSEKLSGISRSLAFQFFDRMFELFSREGTEAMTSAIGDVSIAGAPQHLSRRTRDHAIDGPAGDLTDALLNILNSLKLQAGAGIPKEIRDRIEQLWTLPRDGADHAVCVTIGQLPWLHAIDPVWARRRIVPMLDPSHAFAEPAWSGMLSQQEIPHPELFALVKRHFLKVFDKAAAWQWDRGGDALTGLVERLVIATCWHKQDKRYVRFADARIALRSCDDGNRAHALRFLATSYGRDSWMSFGKPFLKNAWPRESRFQTPQVSAALAYLAEESGEHFPDVVRTVLPLLVPVDSLEMSIHEAISADGGEPLAARFPEAMLQLLEQLVLDNPPYAPYQLDTTLEVIASALPRLRDDVRWRRLNMIITKG